MVVCIIETAETLKFTLYFTEQGPALVFYRGQSIELRIKKRVGGKSETAVMLMECLLCASY